jgi:hypothetical protein
VEIEAAASWSFGLDAPLSVPSGELAIGYSWPRIGALLRGGVSGASTATTPSMGGPVSAVVRQAQIAAEAHVDLPVRGGAVRLAAGPAVVLLTAEASGALPSRKTILAEPGLFVRAAYRLELGKFALSAGAVLEALFVAENLTVSGLGLVGRTPLVQLGPFLAAAGRL